MMESYQKHSEKIYITVLGKGQISQDLSTSRELKTIGNVSSIRKFSIDRALSDAIRKSDIIIFPSESSELEIGLRINKLSLKLDKPICYVQLEKDLSIASLIIPGVTPCYLCACFRRLACTENISDRLTNASTGEKVSEYGSKLKREISKLVFRLVETYRNREWSHSNFSNAFVIINETHETKRHAFMRRDDCPLCSSQHFSRHNSSKPLIIPFYHKLNQLMNPYFGVIKKIEKTDVIPVSNEVIDQPIILRAELSNYRLYQGGQETLTCYGKGWSDADAFCSAMGESVERYSSYCWQPAQLVRGRKSDVQGICPRKISLYKDYQYKTIPYVEYHDELILTWVQGKSVFTQKSVFVPALSIFSDWSESTKEPRIFESTTSGLATGSSQEMAFNSALLELVERDAFILAWMLRSEGKRLDLRSHPSRRVREFVEFHERLGFEVVLIQIPSDSPAKVVAAFFVSGCSNRLEPAVTMGLGVSASLGGAANRAVLELAQVFYLLREKLRDPRILKIMDKLVSGELPITQPIHHGLYYCHEKSKGKIRGFLDCQIDKTPTWQSEECDSTFFLKILAWISSMKGDVFMVNLTPISLQELELHTVKLIATNLQPIHFGENQERLESFRLARILRESGMDYSGLNRDVHPLS